MKNNIMNILEKTEAVLKGHFLLSSGKHSDTYIQCAKVLMYPDYAEMFGEMIADKLDDEVDIVVSPALGGIIIGYETAKALGKKFIFSERNSEGNMDIRRGFVLEENLRILIVEDVITTGKSTKEVIEVLKNYKPKKIYKACIVNRGSIDEIDGDKIISLIDIKPDIYEEDDCPLCKNGDKPIKPGSRK